MKNIFDKELIETIDMLDKPTFICVDKSINEVRGVVRGGNDTRVVTSVEPFRDTSDVIRAFGPGSFGTLGSYVRSGLAGMGAGYSVNVVDFGEVVTVAVTYCNARTGRSSGQSFVIICRPAKVSKYAYTVYAHSARWRDCNDYNQAITFIRSKATALAGQTSGSV